MIKKIFNKTISITLTLIFIYSLFPSSIFAFDTSVSSNNSISQPFPGDVKGFNRAVFDSHFSKADREINPDRWLIEAKHGISQAINAWELMAISIYDDPLFLENAKNQIVNWSNEELEKRFSQWLIGRFFGDISENAINNLSQMLEKTQTSYSWHLDDEGNILFDSKTGDPMIIRPDDDGREFSIDLLSWRNDTKENIYIVSFSFEKDLINLFPELLAYIPFELRESMRSIINESSASMKGVIKREFEDIAAREERIFTNRRTRDIWSLRKKSDEESARLFTEKLISETEEACKIGIDSINVRIEQAIAGTGDLSLLGEEWLSLYKEQFDRGLKAWEEAEERFFIRRIEWEQESFKMFSEGEEIWLTSFRQLEEQRQKWELNAKELFNIGETLFINLSEEFNKSINDAKKEFELNMAMRIGEGTTRAKALIDMYLISASAAISTKENIVFWLQQYGEENTDPLSFDFLNWIKQEMKNLWIEAEENFKIAEKNIRKQRRNKSNMDSIFLKQNDINNDSSKKETDTLNMEHLFQIQNVINNDFTIKEQKEIANNIEYNYLSKNKFDLLVEMDKLFSYYLSYIDKAIETRDLILKNYTELLGTGMLKDILSPNASSEDFCLDEYQIALIRAKTLVLYWERKTEIAEAVISYAEELTAGRMTEAETIRAWEDSKRTYNESLIVYEKELKKLNEIGIDISKQQEVLDNLAQKMKVEEDKLNNLQSEYSALLAVSIVDRGNFFYLELNNKYDILVDEYKKFYKTGINAVYKTAIDYGSAWAILEQKENAQNILNNLINGEGDILSIEQLKEFDSKIDILRLAAINLFSDNLDGKLRSSDSNFSGADWYEKAKGIKLTDYEKTELYGEKLLDRLINDYKESSKQLLEERIDFELILLQEYINFCKDLKISSYQNLIINCLIDVETAFYIYEILQNLNKRVALGESYYTNDFNENNIINYFVSGDSFFTGSNQYLTQYFDDNNFCLGLLNFFSDYALYSSFYQKEIWKESCNSLTLLFDNYGIEINESDILPDIFTISTSLFKMSGNYAENTAQFLINLDDCFSMIPKWLEIEIDRWKNVLIESVSAYALYYKIQPKHNINYIYNEYEKIQTQYDALVNYSSSLYFIDEKEAEIINNNFKNLFNKKYYLDYLITITRTLENIKINENLSGNELHWRQYLTSKNIKNEDLIIASANTWQEGILEDILFKADYISNRMNESLELFLNTIKDAKYNKYISYGNADYYLNLYENESTSVDMYFNSIGYISNDLIKLVKAYEISKLNSEEAAEKLKICEQELNNQQKINNDLRNKYFIEVERFITYGSFYDDQYSILKKVHETSNEKRFEYEKQDAIKRWASTAYLNTDINNLENNKVKLEKAKTVLDVLSNLYNDENSRSYKNSEYSVLYSAYEQSFNRILLLNETINTVSSVSAQEYKNNEKIFSAYQNSLYKLGYIDQDYNYISGDNISLWSIKDIITVKDGRLAFSRDDSMRLSGIDASKADALKNYFNTNITKSGLYHDISLFEDSLRTLSERMNSYLNNWEKFKQWSLARDYLITSLINANGDLEFIEKYFLGQGQMEEEGAIGLLYSREGVFYRNKKIYEVLGNDSLLINKENIFFNAWNILSDEEKADLEYYVILTLSGYGNDYLNGFSKMYTLDVYNLAFNYVERKYNHAVSESEKWYNFLWQWAWWEMRDVNKIAIKNINAPLSVIRSEVNNWINGLSENLISINSYYSAYIESCKKIDTLEGKNSNKQYITWDDINNSLSITQKISTDQINELKNYWDEMHKKSNYSFDSVSQALTAMLYWAKDTERYTKSALETHWNENMYEQQQNEKNFLSVVNAYINGEANIEELKKEANKTYGNNASAWKNHFNNMYTIMFNNLSAYLDLNTNMLAEFNPIGNELILVTADTLEKRYYSEYSAREVEWQQIIKEISDKFNEWQISASLILENGRMDWTLGFHKMEISYQQWIKNFQNEYDRVSAEWNEAYLAGLEDKEMWLEQVSNAANQASESAFLSLIGTEGERLSRFADTREPFSIRNEVPEAQNIISELLQSSGIVNMSNAFGSINNISSTISINVKRGMKGTTWDSNLIKTAAADLARQTNKEIADNESRILAYNARLNAEEIVKSLSTKVERSNDNFRENMDNHFIFNGLWKKSGNNYVKEIVRGSTLFTPVINETAYIGSYVNYVLEPVTLKTNLDENFLANLDSVAIRGLLENIIQEVEAISFEIFGDENNKIKINKNNKEREQSPGKFGAYIGYVPANKPFDEMGKTKNEMFFDFGAGELGRLMSEYIYWHVVNTKGSNELSLALWDKRMWNDEGSWFKAPSLRFLGTLAASIIAGACTFGSGFAVGLAISVAINVSAELLFGTLDVAMGYKKIDEVAFSIGKTILTSTVSGAIGGGFSSISETIMNGVNGTFNTLLTQTMLAGAQTFTTGFATSLINGITYDSKNGLGYSSEIFASGMKSMFTNTLTSMVSTFTSSSLKAINSSNDILIGFNNSNKKNLLSLNNLLGSVAGQGVNYALGNNFSLNLLNLSLFSGGTYQSGLLELNFGRDGISMNLGTGGANFSIDNLISSIQGAKVWHTNNRINSYTSNEANGFDAAVALRAQYGYGNNVQRNQLWDILNGNVIINTGADGDYYAQTSRQDGKKVINLANYKQGMSVEDQFRLAAILGHEAYRDGYLTNNNYLETRTATLSHTKMTIQMLQSGEKVAYDENMAKDILAYLNADMKNDFNLFYSYVDGNYDSSADFWKLVISDNSVGFEWDGQYTFDLSAIGIEGRVNSLDEDALQLIYYLSQYNATPEVFRDNIEKFYTLNNIMQAFETALNVDPKLTMSNDIFNDYKKSFLSALRAVGSSGLLAEKAAVVLPLEGGQNVFANGGGALTSDYGWRVINGNFQWHNAWDLGARGDSRLVAPMDGIITFGFTQSHGIQITTSGGNNESIIYSHSNALSLRNFVDLFSYNGVSMNENGQLTGILQNMVIGIMGNTGNLSQSAHVDLIYKINGITQNPVLFFNQNGNTFSFPSTDYSTSMSGLSLDPKRENLSLTYSQISGIYDYLYKENSATAWNNLFNIGAKSNNFYQFIQAQKLIQGRSTP